MGGARCQWPVRDSALFVCSGDPSFGDIYGTGGCVRVPLLLDCALFDGLVQQVYCRPVGKLLKGSCGGGATHC